MAIKVFIDGAAGTTGLEIRHRLAGRSEVVLAALNEAQRKDASARAAMLNESDIVILCLPDDAAREAVAMIENPNVRVIDSSTAHRTAKGWVYGFAEMEPGQRDAIGSAKRLSNPGCYSTGFIALVRPLVRSTFLPADWPVTVNAISGYSGGGRSMIAEFEDKGAPNNVVVRTYDLSLNHKHVEEMRVHAGLTHRPLFAPSVGRFYRGMLVDVPLQLWALPGRPKISDLHTVLVESYKGEPFVEVAPLAETAEMKTLNAEELKNTNRMKIYVFGNEAHEQARIVAVLDNLGKGASGAAVQNLNVMMGWPETKGLV